MRSLKRKGWAKALAFALLCLSALAACGFATALEYREARGGSGGLPAFSTTELCQSWAYGCAETLQSNVSLLVQEDADLAESLPALPEGLACRIYAGDALLLDTAEAGAQYEPVLSFGLTATTWGAADNRYTAYADADGTVELTAECFLRTPVQRGDGAWQYFVIYQLLQNAVLLIAGLVLAVLAAVCCFAFLIAGAGYGQRTEEVDLSGWHRIPLDLYAAFCALVCVWALDFIDGIGYAFESTALRVVALAAAALLIFATVLSLLVTFAARFKAGGFWKNTVLFRLLFALFRAVRWLFRGAARVCRAVFAGLPVGWRAGLTLFALCLLNGFGGACAALGAPWLALLVVLADAMALYAVLRVCVQLRQLRQEGAALAAGQLDRTLELDAFWPALREHAADLNSVGSGMALAVEERMKSERFRTELITNVSHDLKTPLTSIISYVDLLRTGKPSAKKQAEYLEVLERQSAKLKKLTEDLIEASKASSGTLKLLPERIDLGELLEQTAGEYRERFSAAGLTLVESRPEQTTEVLADGRHLWRVIDNLLQNALKYSQSGTRVYFALLNSGTDARLTLKNISKEPLNISADELMERFVRADASRNTEGSGLGLSIARSLAELMGGALTLELDGDLFKAELRFPLAGEEQPQGGEPREQAMAEAGAAG